MNTHTTNLPAIETHTFPNSHIISCLNLNLAQIAASGQCFRMLPVPEKPGIWSLISGTHYLEISGTPDGFFFDCPDEALPFWKQYFDLGTDYGSFIASILRRRCLPRGGGRRRFRHPDSPSGSLGNDDHLPDLPAENHPKDP